VRSHLYEVTDEIDARIEALFLQYVIGGWIAFNFTLLPILWLLEMVERIIPHLREMQVHTQDWLLSALHHGYQAQGMLEGDGKAKYTDAEKVTVMHVCGVHQPRRTAARYASRTSPPTTG
jgi:hypothetical protein